jgi:hypothetical protein
MFEKHLNKYKTKDVFSFTKDEIFQIKCNAPIDKGGVYLIYQIHRSKMNLLYIGSSGQKQKGNLKIRKSGLGGMKDRLVNGYHPKFGKIKRKKIFPMKMMEQNISELRIFWWITHGDNFCDFPTDVESILCDIYRKKFDKLPEWHK